MSTAAKKKKKKLFGLQIYLEVLHVRYIQGNRREGKKKKKTIKVRGSLVSVIRKLLPYGQIMK